MTYNSTAFSNINDRRYRNWDGYSLAYTYDFIKAIEPLVNLNTINTIMDIGSRDACQAMELSDWFPDAQIYLFEPVPSSFEYCKSYTSERHNIKCHNIALSNTTGQSTFYEVVDGNVGASSLLQTKEVNDIILSSGLQRSIDIQTIRGDNFIQDNAIDKVDLIWMDVQGAELIVLEGFGDEIKKVKAIHTEVAVNSHYKNGTVLSDLLQYMQNMGFVPVRFIGQPNELTELDVVFVNNNINND